MWWKIAPYLVAAAAVIGVLVWVESRGYDRGHAAAQKTCTETTVPAAEAVVQARCDALTNSTKEENDAIYRDLANLRGVYDRLRQQKPIIAKCLPLASPSHGNARADGAPELAAGVGVHTEWLDNAFYDAATDIARGRSCQRQLHTFTN